MMRGFGTALARTAGILGAVAVAASLAACGSGSDKSNVSQTNSATTQKYDPPIELWVAGDISDNMQSILTDTNTIENNMWTKAYEEELGIKIKYKWIAQTAAESYENMSVAIATGNLPDLFGVGSTELKTLGDSGVLAELQGHYDQHISPLAKEIMEAEGSLPFDAMKLNGKLLALPRLTSTYDNAPALIWYRTDWVENLAMDPPETIDDVFALMEAFTTKDPDGNGKKDTVGLGVCNNILLNDMGLQMIFNAYNAYPNMWIEDGNGGLVNGSIQPQVKTALSKIRELYSKGYIDKQFSASSQDKVAHQIQTGKVGMIFGAQWMPIWPLNANVTANPAADWAAVTITGADGQPVRTQTNLGTTAGYAMRSDYEHPEAVVKMMNLYFEKMYGETGDIALYGTGEAILGEGNTGPMWSLSPVNGFRANQNFLVYEKCKKALEDGDTSGMDPDTKVTFDAIQRFRAGDMTGWASERIFGPEGSWSILTDVRDNNLLCINKFYGAATDAMATYGTTLSFMQNDAFLKIIMSETSLDTFDTFVSDWKRQGGDEITQEVNAWYQANQS